jgi:hypothetical protein
MIRKRLTLALGSWMEIDSPRYLQSHRAAESPVITPRNRLLAGTNLRT